jgi:hypothetical protein
MASLPVGPLGPRPTGTGRPTGRLMIFRSADGPKPRKHSPTVRVHLRLLLTSYVLQDTRHNPGSRVDRQLMEPQQERNLESWYPVSCVLWGLQSTFVWG